MIEKDDELSEEYLNFELQGWIEYKIFKHLQIKRLHKRRKDEMKDLIKEYFISRYDKDLNDKQLDVIISYLRNKQEHSLNDLRCKEELFIILEGIG